LPSVLSTYADSLAEAPGGGAPQAGKAESRLVVSWRALLLGVLLLGTGVAVAVGISLQSSVPAPVIPRIRVVASPTEPAQTAAQPSTLAPAAGGATGPSETAGSPQGDPTHTTLTPSPAPAPEPRAHAGINPRTLTRTFRAQQSKIETCFAVHSKGLMVQPEIQVEFDLESSGKIKRVRVLPETFASSELGGCIERVARTTKFSKQGQSVSFAIPVRASRSKRN
jgi:hypothetical protein